MIVKGIDVNKKPILIKIEGNKIVAVEDYSPQEGEKLNLIMPGFINVHVHGGYLFDFTFADKELASEYLYKIAKYDGVTSVVGTMITEVPDKVFHAIEIQKDLLDNSPGANLVGYHLEGPFISLEKKGAHDPKMIMPMTDSLVKRYVENVPEGVWKIWTYAPEYNDVHFVKWMRENNIIPSIGHSAAHPKTAIEHVDNGALSVTHFDNAITKVAEGEDQLAAVMLRDDRLYKEMIFDGIHVKVPLMERVVNTVPRDKLMMITDALHIAGMPNGTYKNLNVTDLISKDGVGYNSEGVLNGSAKRFIESFKYAKDTLNLDLDYLQQITSTNQAQMLHLNKGKLEEGYDADIILLDDEFNVTKTIVMGKEIE